MGEFLYLQPCKAENAITKNSSPISNFPAVFRRITALAAQFYRRLKETLDLTFLYEHTKACYGSTGNPSIDPVVFFKFMLISYLETITSDRKLIEHCSRRLAMLYFLGYNLDEPLPWHSTLSRTRQLYPEALFELLFDKVFSRFGGPTVCSPKHGGRSPSGHRLGSCESQCLHGKAARKTAS